MVEIERDTGTVKLLRYVAVDDVGNVINPMIVDGQLHGGIAQGVGQALWEGAVYDEGGQLVTGELMDYAMPRTHNLVQFELDRTVTPCPHNPLGVKGVGEAGAIASPAAVVNAVVDALSHLGITHIDMPLTPEKVWRAMKRRGCATGRAERSLGGLEMYPAQFDYHRASSVAQALDLLGSKQDAKLLAGGHSLLPMMKLRLAQPANLIDIGGIKELTGIERSGSSVRIGALTTHAELAASDVLKKSCPIVAEAAAKIGDPQVRNRGTIGGNLTHADPGSDLPAVVKALDATLHLQSKKREAHGQGAATSSSTCSPRRWARARSSPRSRCRCSTAPASAYLKFEHPASGYAVVGAAAIVRAKDGKCESARLCFNGVTATPLDAQGWAARSPARRSTTRRSTPRSTAT